MNVCTIWEAQYLSLYAAGITVQWQCFSIIANVFVNLFNGKFDQTMIGKTRPLTMKPNLCFVINSVAASYFWHAILKPRLKCILHQTICKSNTISACFYTAGPIHKWNIHYLFIYSALLSHTTVTLHCVWLIKNKTLNSLKPNSKAWEHTGNAPTIGSGSVYDAA